MKPPALFTLAAATLLAGCASLFNPATNEPLAPGMPHGMGAPSDIVGENAIALSFSGGGLRAAAFSHGVLLSLAAMKTSEGDLLDDVTFIGSVSGGSLTAAYYGINGRDGLANFRQQVLLQDFEGNMRLSALLPWNIARIVGGGLNMREDFGERLDREVFHGATFADIYRRPKPDIRIHATDLYHRIAFPFIPRAFAILCSDLPRYSVADAVAASMAVPVVFAPVLLRTYPSHCQEPLPATFAKIRSDPDAARLSKATEAGMRAYRDAKEVRFLKLVDGGIADNLGVSTLIVSRAVMGTPYAPMTERDAVKVRRMLFVIVDASRGPGGDWTLAESGPSGVDMALDATNAAVDSAARLAVDAFGRMLREWQESVIAFRCGLSDLDIGRLGGPAAGKCADVKFSLAVISLDRLEEPHRTRVEAIPTRLTLTERQIDHTIEAGRVAMQALPRLRDYAAQRITR